MWSRLWRCMELHGAHSTTTTVLMGSFYLSPPAVVVYEAAPDTCITQDIRGWNDWHQLSALYGPAEQAVRRPAGYAACWATARRS
ncbi:MAG: hypothetical protein SFY80_10090, partial [Verrucomicrobiota bacterium]|nr:hypothetical protein [Verrucomicrobiota bacterium]